MKDAGRIVFAKNPWPKGHRIKRFVWKGRVEAETVWFDFTLETASYDEGDKARGDDEDDESEDDWRSKVVWENFGGATISSLVWPGEASGILVGTPKKPLDFTTLAQKALRADKKPVAGKGKPAFRTYLLGHDAVADHTMTFAKKRGGFAVAWSGRICLAYVGRSKYEYRFDATIPLATFGGFSRAAGLEKNAARGVLDRCVIGGDKWKLGAPAVRKQ